MKKILAIASLLCLLSATTGSAAAQSNYWRDQNGQPLPQTPSVQSQDGFGGSIVITSDADWKQKWETPPEAKPNFTVASQAGVGQSVTLLIFFTNAKLDEASNVNVRCDISIIDPAGKVAVLRKEDPCFDGPMPGAPANIYLARPYATMSFDAGDARGVWTFEVNLRDEVRKVTLPLRTSIEFK